MPMSDSIVNKVLMWRGRFTLGEDEASSLPITAVTAEGARAGGVDVPSGAKVFGAGPPGATAGLGPAQGA